jgi:hypothetical protein
MAIAFFRINFNSSTILHYKVHILCIDNVLRDEDETTQLAQTLKLFIALQLLKQDKKLMKSKVCLLCAI